MFWDTLLLLAAVVRFMYTAMLCRLAAVGAYRIGRLRALSAGHYRIASREPVRTWLVDRIEFAWFRIFGHYLEPWTGELDDLELMDCEGCR